MVRKQVRKDHKTSQEIGKFFFVFIFTKTNFAKTNSIPLKYGYRKI